jgi:hypothetical protein
MIGRFKNFFGENLPRFRSSQSAYFAICAAIIACNLAPFFEIRVYNNNLWNLIGKKLC